MQLSAAVMALLASASNVASWRVIGHDNENCGGKGVWLAESEEDVCRRIPENVKSIDLSELEDHQFEITPYKFEAYDCQHERDVQYEFATTKCVVLETGQGYYKVREMQQEL